MIGVPELIVLVVLGLLAIPSILAFIDIMRSNLEAGGGIRRAVVHGCPQKGSSPAFRLQHPEDSTQILPLRP